MTLTVRLDTAIESALVRHCAERGVTKSRVVQESLAAYLLDHAAVPARPGAAGPGKKPAAPVSANHKAFADAGFIGGGELGGVSATKAVVRGRAMERIRRNAG